ncbi:helix-turn-helix domain-containing protein [Actinomadura bangladeshensis]|uniref:XRE family transcriptional regulator n=1 Tax=Actinomadura bangladeshensis TaxID=453573 RepID=A0A4R4NU85_9ACTN|nr:helix-turn-helix transcriptional regulator [Actinomadura bangladeshensis]TDC11623.1 XRE family transcriptional regulator [Actinomadura bangladeshensis]
MNDLLRRALEEARLTEDDVAKRLDVDPKTVRRWLSGRIPYPRHRATLCALLNHTADDLWPQLSAPRPLPEPPGAQILATYPHRWAVPRAVWQRHFASARHDIGILAYAGLFLAEDQGVMRTIADKARDGVAVRILLGNPDGPRISERGADEGVGDSLAAKIRNALVLYEPLRDLDNVEIRLHDTVLYNSIYRADNDLLINSHAYGIPASHSPVLHLRSTQPTDMATTYQQSFDRVWSGTGASNTVRLVTGAPE